MTRGEGLGVGDGGVAQFLVVALGTGKRGS
jgi:hypothetical protein